MSIYETDSYYQEMQSFTEAANYLSVAMTYLKDDPLCQRPLVLTDLKPHIRGHFGTLPAQNLIYTQVNRLIHKYQQQALVLQGPGHGGAALVANAYLNNDLVKIYPKLNQSKAGLLHLFRAFAAPFGFSSHPEPAIPGAIHPGGELGYVLVHGYGAVLGHKKLLSVCIIGDGEAETAPLQASWQLNHLLTPKDGKVLPIVTINGLGMNHQTRLAKMSDNQLNHYFKSLEYVPFIVSGNALDVDLQTCFAKVVDAAMAALNNGQSPMILLKTPKGMTGPAVAVGKTNSHQLPFKPPFDDEKLSQLNDWLLTYAPDSHFDTTGKPIGMADVIPKDGWRVTDNSYTNRTGLPIQIQNTLEATAIKIDAPGEAMASNTVSLDLYLNKIALQNPKPDEFLLFSPDEARSENLSLKTHSVDEFLSEHLDEGLLEGFLQTGGSGIFASYEAFLPVVSSMIDQHLKWLTQANRHSWRKDLNALNILGTATVWEQASNGFTHQNPELLTTLAAKNPELVRLYLPADINTTLSVVNHMLKTHQQVNYMVTPKKFVPQWFSLAESQYLVQQGLNVVEWASDPTDNPDIVLAAAGAAPFTEVLLASNILKVAHPELKIRVVYILDLLRLQHPTLNPRGITDNLYNDLFTKDKPIIVNFHGYPATYQSLLAYRHNLPRFINGYHEEGSVTTDFDLRAQNGIDRFDIVKEVLLALGKDTQPLDQALFDQMTIKLRNNTESLQNSGVDLPDVLNWHYRPLQEY